MNMTASPVNTHADGGPQQAALQRVPWQQTRPLAITPLVQRQTALADKEEEEAALQSQADVQRQSENEAEEEDSTVQAKPLIESQAENEEEERELELQSKTLPGQRPAVTSGVASGISAMQGRGQALSPDTRRFMEPRFGHDFSKVRIHADNNAVNTSQQINARAFTVGNTIAFNAGQYQPHSASGRKLLAHELTHVVQQTGKGASIQRAPDKEPKLLKDFAAKFSDAAELIRKSPEAMVLVNEAATAGVDFGGYAEDGPWKNAWAYTAGNKVYVPKDRTDKVLAMSDFLFELNNAIRAPKFAKLDKEAAKGAKGKLTAKQFAYKNTELEVEGMLRMGEIWFEMKKTIGKGTEWNKYDNEFYLSEYKAFKEKRETKDDIVKDVLQRKFSSGKYKGKTHEQFYIDQYNDLSSGK